MCLHGGIFSAFDCVDGSWIAFAPVAGLTRDYFALSSTTPVNWLSTVVLFVYCIVSPLTAYIFHRHGVRTGVFPFIGRVNDSSLLVPFLRLLGHGSNMPEQRHFQVPLRW